MVPRRHVEQPMNLLPDEVLAIYTEIQRLQRKVIGNLAPGCDTWQKYQPFAPQGRIKVDHVHFHVIPRNPNDRLFMTPQESQFDAFEPLTPNEQEEMFDLFKESETSNV